MIYNVSGCFYHYCQLALLRESVGVGIIEEYLSSSLRVGL